MAFTTILYYRFNIDVEPLIEQLVERGKVGVLLLLLRKLLLLLLPRFSSSPSWRTRVVPAAVLEE